MKAVREWAAVFLSLVVTACAPSISGQSHPPSERPPGFATASALVQPSPPDGGLGPDEAMIVSRDANRALGDAAVVSLVAGPFATISDRTSTAVRSDRWVWIVRWRGEFPFFGCPVSGSGTTPYPCPSAYLGTAEVILDYMTGEVLVWRTASDAP